MFLCFIFDNMRYFAQKLNFINKCQRGSYISTFLLHSSSLHSAASRKTFCWTGGEPCWLTSAPWQLGYAGGGSKNLIGNLLATLLERFFLGGGCF